ncbi:hypothetical protein D3C80_1369290 [compost metagenome]
MLDNAYPRLQLITCLLKRRDGMQSCFFIQTLANLLKHPANCIELSEISNKLCGAIGFNELAQQVQPFASRDALPLAYYIQVAQRQDCAVQRRQ